MKIVLINSDGEKDITQIVGRVTWSGEYSQVARRIEISIAVSPNDYYMPKASIVVGNLIRLYEGERLLFSGYVFNKDHIHNSNSMSITAYDGAIYLLKSEGAYNFKNKTAEGIAEKICTDFKLPAGAFSKTGITQALKCIGDNLYDIIMKAYTKAAQQNGKKYLMMMDNNKINVIERGGLAIDYILEDGKDLTESTYSESIENMINAVQIIDDSDEFKIVGHVKNSEWIKSFGTFQKVYKKEDGVSATESAQNMLKGVERTGTIEALGNIDCVTGYAVGIKDVYTGLVGVFQIDSDTHVWENGVHTMSISVNFDEIMDEKTYRTRKKKNAVNATLQWKE